MSAPKHTAGWQWRMSDDGSPERLVDATGASVLAVDEHCGHAWPEVSEANARLIAAAPDLLEVALDLLNSPLTNTNALLEAKAKARAAITKATGESAS